MSYPTKKLGEICEIGPKKSEVNILDENLEVSFVPMKILEEKKKYFFPEERKKIKEVYKGYTYFIDGDVLLAKVTPCFENGKSGIAKGLENGIGFGSSEFYVFRTGKACTPEFLYHFFSRSSFLKEGKKQMSGAVGLQRVPKKYLESLQIPLPPLPTQKLIVQKLDTAFEEIDKQIDLTTKNRNNLDELEKSVLKSFGEFEEIFIGDIAEKIFAGGDLPKDKTFTKEKTEEYTIPIYANAVKKDGLYGYTHTPKVLEKAITISARGTIGFTKLRLEPFYPIVRLLVLIPKKDKADLKYLEYIINTINLKKFGSSIPQLSVPQLKNFQIPLPSLPKQKEIVAYLDNIFEKNKKLKAFYETELKNLQELKQSLLREAFENENFAK